ncbi:hypothetical protein [Halospina sp. K52047b]|uniref:hypothetical protein n=1 Tax=Halospina sp. K52047b TaxID=2614160 RepID=UPI001249D406|nr:hypothetical protein [Halospina sp. K52047b]KAA8982949.1 hypothetical protein F3089_07430 [Halospina sp. K52047b]
MSQNSFSDEETRRARRKAALLFLIAILPLMAATVMYYTGWGMPGSTTNKGEFVEGNEQVLDQGIRDPDGEPFRSHFLQENKDAKWWILVTAADCGDACVEWLDRTGSVHQLLHRDWNRVRRGFISRDGSVPEGADDRRLVPLSAGEANPLAAYTADDAEATVFIVDPMGNLVLRYDQRHSGDDVLEDLEHLLEVSPLG